MCRVPNSHHINAAYARSSRLVSNQNGASAISSSSTEDESVVPTSAYGTSLPSSFDWQQDEALLLAGLGQLEPLKSEEQGFDAMLDWVGFPPTKEDGMILADYPTSDSSLDCTISPNFDSSLFQGTSNSQSLVNPLETPRSQLAQGFEWPLPSPFGALLATFTPSQIDMAGILPPVSLKPEAEVSQPSTTTESAPGTEVVKAFTLPKQNVPTLRPVPASKRSAPAATSGQNAKRAKIEDEDLFSAPASPSDHESICTIITPDMTPEQIKVAKRERNRLAAEKYRRKGRELIEKLQVRCNHLSSENENLRVSMAQMAEDLRVTRELLQLATTGRFNNESIRMNCTV